MCFKGVLGTTLEESKPFPTLPPRHQCFLASFHQGFQATLSCKGGTTTVTTDGANLSSESLRDIRKCRYNPWLFVVWNEAKSTSQKKGGKDIKELFHIPGGVLFEKKKRKAVGKKLWMETIWKGTMWPAKMQLWRKWRSISTSKTAAPGETVATHRYWWCVSDNPHNCR